MSFVHHVRVQHAIEPLEHGSIITLGAISK